MKPEIQYSCEECSVSFNEKDIDRGLLKYMAYLDKFKKGEILTLASVQQLKEGINIPKLKASIILHAFASEYVTKQKIGRLLRLPVNELAVVHILMYKDTVDEHWVKKALQDYNPEKIIYL